jgi:hypothetical protein
MADSKKIEGAFDKFEAAAKKARRPGARTAAAAFPDPCATWKSLRGPWQAIIDALTAVGTLVPIAKRAAAAMTVVKELLDALCPP